MSPSPDNIDALIATLEKLIESCYTRYKLQCLTQPLSYGMFCAGVHWQEDGNEWEEEEKEEEEEETRKRAGE